MGCSSSKSIIIKDLNIENELKEEIEEIIDIDVFKDELKPPFEKKPEESEKPNIIYDEKNSFD